MVDYGAMDQVLKWFNFGPKFREIIQILFKQFRLVTINFGYTSDPFIPTRALFQGNPISSYLFLLIIEVLTIQLCANPKIKGIKVGEDENLLIQFADDLGLTIEFKQSAWEAAVNTFSMYESQTGMQINYNKSLVYRIGLLRNSDAKFYSNKKLIWSEKSFTVLGVQIDKSQSEQTKINLEPLLKKSEAILKS